MTRRGSDYAMLQRRLAALAERQRAEPVVAAAREQEHQQVAAAMKAAGWKLVAGNWTQRR